MNQRIRELAVQAYQYALNESKTVPNLCVVGSDYFLAMEKEKFAELIVSECMIMSDLPLSVDGKYDDFLPSQMIAKHFGVE